MTEKLLATLRIKAADTVGRESRGYDAGKKINGRKRFIITGAVIRELQDPKGLSETCRRS